MRNRLLAMAILLGVSAAGCSSAVDGRGTAVPTTGASRTLSTPGADDPTTRPSTQQTSTGQSPTGTGTTSTSTSGTTSTSSSTTSSASTAGLPDVLLGPVDIGPDAGGSVVVQSPSGNIFCFLGSVDGASAVRCDLLDADYPDLPSVPCPDSGDFHAGTASLDSDGSATVGGCISDTVIQESAVVLPYGSNAGVGDVVCHAAEDGVTCGNLLSGHGFQVARTAHRVF